MAKGIERIKRACRNKRETLLPIIIKLLIVALVCYSIKFIFQCKINDIALDIYTTPYRSVIDLIDLFYLPIIFVLIEFYITESGSQRDTSITLLLSSSNSGASDFIWYCKNSKKSKGDTFLQICNQGNTCIQELYVYIFEKDVSSPTIYQINYPLPEKEPIILQTDNRLREIEKIQICCFFKPGEIWFEFRGDLPKSGTLIAFPQWQVLDEAPNLSTCEGQICEIKANGFHSGKSSQKSFDK